MDDRPHNTDETMENQTQFDLNLAIRRWRAKLNQSPTVSSQSADELESHLRDSSIALESAGLSAEEAFMVAAKRMGTTVSLEEEYEKITPHSRKIVLGPHHWGVALVLLVLLVIFMSIAPLTPRGLDAAVPQAPPPSSLDR